MTLFLQLLGLDYQVSSTLSDGAEEHPVDTKTSDSGAEDSGHGTRLVRNCPMKLNAIIWNNCIKSCRAYLPLFVCKAKKSDTLLATELDIPTFYYSSHIKSIIWLN